MLDMIGVDVIQFPMFFLACGLLLRFMNQFLETVVIGLPQFARQQAPDFAKVYLINFAKVRADAGGTDDDGAAAAAAAAVAAAAAAAAAAGGVSAAIVWSFWC